MRPGTVGRTGAGGGTGLPAAHDLERAVAALRLAPAAERGAARAAAAREQAQRALDALARRRGQPGQQAQRMARERGRRRARPRHVEPAEGVEQRLRGGVGRLLLGDERVGRLEQVRLGGRVQAAEGGQQVVADAVAGEAPVLVRGVLAPADAGRAQRGAHLLAAEREQRPHASAAVGRRQRAQGGAARRAREAVEDRLDAVVPRVARRDRPAARVRVGGGAAGVARPRLEPGAVGDRAVDGDQRHRQGGAGGGAGLGVGLALLAAQAVAHVQRLDAVAQLVQGVQQERRVGAARDQREHRLAGPEQALGRDVLLHAREDVAI